MFQSVSRQLTRNCKGPVIVAIAKRRLASTYAAAVCTDYGKPLEIQQLERPSLESGQVSFISTCQHRNNCLCYSEYIATYDFRVIFRKNVHLS